MTKLIGYGLVSVAIIATILAFANTSLPTSQSAVSVLQGAVFTVFRDGEHPYLGPIEDCSDLSSRLDGLPPALAERSRLSAHIDCIKKNEERRRIARMPPPRVPVFVLTFGNTLAATTALGLLGLGLLAFGRR